MVAKSDRTMHSTAAAAATATATSSTVGASLKEKEEEEGGAGSACGTGTASAAASAAAPAVIKSSSSFGFLKRRNRSADSASAVSAASAASVSTASNCSRAQSNTDGGCSGCGDQSRSRSQSVPINRRRAKQRWRQKKFQRDGNGTSNGTSNGDGAQKAAEAEESDSIRSTSIGGPNFGSKIGNINSISSRYDGSTKTDRRDEDERQQRRATASSSAGVDLSGLNSDEEHTSRIDRLAVSEEVQVARARAANEATGLVGAGAAAAGPSRQEGKVTTKIRVSQTTRSRRTTTVSSSASASSSSPSSPGSVDALGGVRDVNVSALAAAAVSSSSRQSPSPSSEATDADTNAGTTDAIVNNHSTKQHTAKVNANATKPATSSANTTSTVTQESTSTNERTRTYTTQTPLSILHHSFIESFWPRSIANNAQDVSDAPDVTERDGNNDSNVNNLATHDEKARHDHNLDDIEDPTVQESIECVFAHQLEDGLPAHFFDTAEVDPDTDEQGVDRRVDDNTRNREEDVMTGDRARSNKQKEEWDDGFDDLVAPLSRTSSRISAAVSAASANTFASASSAPIPTTASDADLVAASRLTASGSGETHLSEEAEDGKGKSTGNTPSRCSRSATLQRQRQGQGQSDDLSKPHDLTSRTWSRKILTDSRSLVFIGTFGPHGAIAAPDTTSTGSSAVNGGEPAVLSTMEPSPSTSLPSSSSLPPSPVCNSCLAGQRHAPSIPPDLWPQAPLMLRPTPGSGMRIRGVRFSGSEEYLWKAPFEDEDEHSAAGFNDCGEGNGISSWSDALKQSRHGGEKGGANVSSSVRSSSCCHQCTEIPINSGNEAEGQSLVVDFESPLFVGSLLMRIRHSSGTTENPYDDSVGYFAGMNRRYQAVVRGMFKKEAPMTKFVTGQVLSRECGKLPPKWMLKGAVKVIKFFAPQLQTKLDGPRPTCISPLGSTPQVFHLEVGVAPDPNFRSDQTIELALEEPSDYSHSLLSQIPDCDPSHAPTSIARAKSRKKAFDKLYTEDDKSLTFRTDTVYTFEFLQHLIDFADFGVELGGLGKIRLKEMLDGQPLKFMAAQKLNGDEKVGVGKISWATLWSFDIFHECLFEDSVKNDARRG